MPGNVPAPTLAIDWNLDILAASMRRFINKALWLVVHKVPWKPILIWGPWVVILLILSFYGIENWRGESAWKKAQERATQEGISLKIKDYAPSRKKGDLEPLFLPGFDGTEVPSFKKMIYLGRAGLDHSSKAKKAYRNEERWQGQPRDLSLILPTSTPSRTHKQTAEELERIAVEFARLREFDSAFEERPLVLSLNTSSPNWQKVSDVSIMPIISLSEALRDDTSIAILANAPERALLNLQHILRLTETNSYPTLILLLVKTSAATLFEAALWETLANDLLSVAQLKTLSARLENVSLEKEIINALDGELAFILDNPEFVPAYLPRGWQKLCQAEVTQQILDLRTLAVARSYPQLADFNHRPTWNHFPGTFYLENNSFEMTFSLQTYALSGVARLRITRIGLALELFQKEHGRYPEQLSELKTDIPLDPFTNREFQYQLKMDGTPHLWSIGTNLIDEQGLPGKDSSEGDIVWMFSPIPGLTNSSWRRQLDQNRKVD